MSYLSILCLSAWEPTRDDDARQVIALSLKLAAMHRHALGHDTFIEQSVTLCAAQRCHNNTTNAITSHNAGHAFPIGIAHRKHG